MGNLWWSCRGGLVCCSCKRKTDKCEKNENKGAEIMLKTHLVCELTGERLMSLKNIERGGTAVLSFYVNVAGIWHSKFKC